MKAITVTSKKSVELKDVPKPEKAAPEHLIIKMRAAGVNAGDIGFINGIFPPGSIPVSLHEVCGVSGVGIVVEIGEGVPAEYKGKKVTVYRSLKFSDKIIGTWSEFSQLHYLQCVILPDSVNAEEYAGSLVNIITPYAFVKQIQQEGHQAIMCTAGTSATGIALLGVCLAYDFPLISIVRDEDGKKELEQLGAKNILVESHTEFKQQLKAMAQDLKATAVFDGVGGAILNIIMDVVPFNTTIFCYGYLGGPTPLTIHTSALMRNITLKSFNNFRSQTVQNTESLAKALKDIASIIERPHFKTKIGKKFKFEEMNEALAFSSPTGGKAILYPSQ